MPIPNPNKGEKHDDFISRCMNSIGGEYDTTEQAVAVCNSTYEKSKLNASAEERVAIKMKGIWLKEEAWYKDQYNSLKSDKFADESGGSYPWDDCIADATERYGDEETAAKVCGAIKAG